jgi:hypothetical protein
VVHMIQKCLHVIALRVGRHASVSFLRKARITCLHSCFIRWYSFLFKLCCASNSHLSAFFLSASEGVLIFAMFITPYLISVSIDSTSS